MFLVLSTAFKQIFRKKARSAFAPNSSIRTPGPLISFLSLNLFRRARTDASRENHRVRETKHAGMVSTLTADIASNVRSRHAHARMKKDHCLTRPRVIFLFPATWFARENAVTGSVSLPMNAADSAVPCFPGSGALRVFQNYDLNELGRGLAGYDPRPAFI